MFDPDFKSLFKWLMFSENYMDNWYTCFIAHIVMSRPVWQTGGGNNFENFMFCRYLHLYSPSGELNIEVMSVFKL